MNRTGFTNLHKSNNGDAMKGIQNIVSQITDKLGNIPELVSKAGFLQSSIPNFALVKKKFLKTLRKRRKKYRLALESLGWGTIADLLDSAFCGEKLNVWV